MRGNVIIGNEFEIETVKVLAATPKECIEIEEARHKMRLRERLVYVCIAVIVVGLVISTAIGWCDESYNELNAFWSAAAVPMGYILGLYFDKSK